MSGVNKVMVLGRLGSDPEVKVVGQGNSVARLSVATSENWTDKNGQKQERVEWHRIVAWGKLADLCGKYLVKGRQVYIEGKLQTRSWDDNGVKKYSTEIIASAVQFLGENSSGNSASEGGESRKQSSGSPKKSTASKKPAQEAEEPDFDNSDFNFSEFGPEPTSKDDDGDSDGNIPF